jgi:CO/xanthine dehydrogenase Mo-binding subunit/CO/xanthine dehydrogenase FAD-binding subunit
VAEAAFRVVGRPTPLLDAPAKVTGEAVYTHDVVRPGLLHARLVRSPHPHAAIRGIDTTAAARAPGVVAVVTAADTPKVRYIYLGGPFSDRYPLALDRVRFVGEPVAAVAADTPEAADAALALVRVDYEVLPAVFTPEAAMAPGAVAIHPPEQCLGGPNVALRSERRYGDPEAGMRAAAHVFEQSFRYPAVLQCPMETNAAVCDVIDGVLHVWAPTQVPQFVQKELAHVLDLPLDRVRVREVAVGGGFGARSKVCEQEAIAALLALKTGRPVKLVYTRAEEFEVTKPRHAKDITLRTGVDAEGRIVARHARAVVDNGAYTHMGPGVMGYGGLVAAAVYRTPNVAFEGRLVYTNKHPGGQYRGFGAAQMLFAIESQMDVMAAALGLDPLEFRLRNATRPGDVTACGWKITSCGLAECLRRAAAAIDWERKRRDPGPNRGVGLAAVVHVSGANVYAYGDFSEAVVEVVADGRVRVVTGSADAGTGSNTLLAMIAAEMLAVPLEAVSVVSMDTRDAPAELGAWASRFTMTGGNATRLAAAQAREELVRAGADLLEAAPRDVRLADGRVFVAGSPERGLAFREIVRRHGPIHARARFDTPTDALGPTGYGNISVAYSFAAHAAEVEVDPDTGRVRVVRYVAAHDVGRALNPLAVEGQIQGGVAMGIGAALQETMSYEGGRLVQRSFLDYRIPLATDLPPIEVILIEPEDPGGPFGAKSVGEPGLVAAPPAIANAVAHATGVRFTELPITPDRVVAALRAHHGGLPRGADARVHPGLWRVAGVRALYPSVVFPLLRRVGARWARQPAAGDGRVNTERPATLAELGRALSTAGGRGQPMSGGTDLLAGMRQGIYQPERVVDVSAVPELSEIVAGADRLRLGAAVRLARLLERHDIRSRLPSLHDAVAHIATPQVRNMATVGGNLCQQKRCWFFRGGFLCYKAGGWTCPCYAVLGDNRQHAVIEADRCAAVGPSDLATVLAALDGTVWTWGPRRERRLPIERFYRGPGEPDLAPGEIVRAVEIPWPAPGTLALYEKVAPREGDFATVSAAITLRVRGLACEQARIVLGGVAARPHRATAAERILAGAPLDAATAGRAAGRVLEHALPLAGNAYKIDVARRLVARLLGRAAARAEAGDRP